MSDNTPGPDFLRQYPMVPVAGSYWSAIAVIMLFPDLPNRIGRWPFWLALAIIVPIDAYAKGLWPQWLRFRRSA